MKFLVCSIILFLFNTSFASSGQWARENIKNSIEFVTKIEKEVFIADEIQVLDYRMKNLTLYISVGPEKGNRPARIYHCWVINFTGEGDKVSSRERIMGKSCDAFH